MFCSNCGQELAPEAKFCSNCGASVNSGAPSGNANESNPDQRERERREDFERAWGGSTESTANERPSEPDASSSDDADSNDSFEGGFATKRPDWEVQREQLRDDPVDEWSMSDLGPAPPRRRRTWLWVLLGTLALIVIACCVFSWWITYTDGGTEWFEGIATQAAEEMQNATEESATPQP